MILVSYFAGKSINCSLGYQIRKNVKTLVALVLMGAVCCFLGHYLMDSFMLRLILLPLIGLVIYIVLSYFQHSIYVKYIGNFIGNMIFSKK